MHTCAAPIQTVLGIALVLRGCAIDDGMVSLDARNPNPKCIEHPSVSNHTDTSMSHGVVEIQTMKIAKHEFVEWISIGSARR